MLQTRYFWLLWTKRAAEVAAMFWSFSGNRRGLEWVGLAALVGAVWIGAGQTRSAWGQGVSDTTSAVAATPASTLEGALHEMSDAAGVIFTGQVLSVRRVASGGAGSGVVEVAFGVEQAVRGCDAGGTYVLREWAGLWANGEPRYQVGQRLLMLLRAPGVGGLSSPVGGMDGAIPIRGAASEIAGSGGAAMTAPAQMVDLRWVGARVLRIPAVVAEPGTFVSGTAVLGTAVSGTAVSGTTVVSGGAGSTGAGSSSVAAQGASVDTVVGMLGAWEQTRVAR